MMNLILLIALMAVILWSAKKFYWPTLMAQHPEKYPAPSESIISKKDASVIMSNLQRWRKEGKISREEYDHLTDICLAEIQQDQKRSNPGD